DYFFSSRRRHTRFSRDWSSDVCSSDLEDKIYMSGVLVNSKAAAGALDRTSHPFGIGFDPIDHGSNFDGSLDDVMIFTRALNDARSEERRVGKWCRPQQ